MESYREAVDYLLAKRLVDASEVVNGEFRIVESSARHRNLRVALRNGRGYFLKIGSGLKRRAGIAREAEIYRFLWATLGDDISQSLLPRFVLFDSAPCVLILELLPRVENLWELHDRLRRFVPRLAARLGRALGKFHRMLQPAERRSLPAGSPRPMVFDFLEPPKSFLVDCSGANLQFLEILQDSRTLCESIRSTESVWSEFSNADRRLIHGDLRFENCCVVLRPLKLRIVDWEFAGAGDPIWDAGCALAGFLSAWLQSAPMPAGADPDRYLSFSLPLGSLKQAARAFWLAYMGTQKLPRFEWFGALRRAMLYAAARLIQLAFERMRNAPAVTMHALSHLQLSQNLFERPVEGAIHLLGIPG
jgi:thiamine kinase-like enzyme